MSRESGSRREFLKHATSIMGGGWLATHAALVIAAAEQAQQTQAQQTLTLGNAAGFEHLSAAEALTLAALCDQIFPPDEQADHLSGASELGAVYFIDAALGSFMAGELPMVRQGLADLDQRAGNTTAFHQLDFDQQTEQVRQIEDTPFFGTVHFLTLCGLFAMPSYGGNANGTAWNMIGYEPRHVWQPPFGYYDARYAQENGHAGS